MINDNRFLFLYNPLKTPFRNSQEEVINKLIDFMEDPSKRYFLCEAPTGSGKSLIALTLARYLKIESHKNCFITSSKNILLDQYAKDYNTYISIMKGKKNYSCLALPNTIYEEAPCQSQSKYKCEFRKNCPYKCALEQALKDPIVFTNLYFLLLDIEYARRFEKRDLLIIDEAHSIESILIDYRTISYTESSIKAVNEILKRIQNEDFIVYKTIKECYKGSYDMIPASKLKDIDVDNLKEVNELLKEIDKFLNILFVAMTGADENLDIDNLNDTEMELYKQYIKDIKYIQNFSLKIESYFNNVSESEWICLPYFAKKTKKHTGFELKPVDATGLAQRILPKIADKVIFMSATIGDKEMFCKNIGLNSNLTDHLSIESDFPKENRPIYTPYVGVYNINTKQEYLKNSIPIIDKIISSHPNMKGIIHTSNYEDADYIYRHSKYIKRIMVHTPKDRNLIIKRFMKSKDGILCSPSCYEGLDLKDDLARFQIIFKIPWGNLGDKLVKRRMAKDKDWYVNTTAIQFCQAVGRAIRSKNDWANTFVLDQTFNRLKNSKFLTDYIKEAIN